MIEIGTRNVGFGPLTVLCGCSSPSRKSTRFGSFSSVTHDVRAVIEYWIDWPKYWRTVLVLLQTRATSAAVPRWESNIEPSPTWFQGTIDGSGTQGVCEEVGVDLGQHGLVAGGELKPLELGVHVLVGHRRVAEVGPL